MRISDPIQIGYPQVGGPRIIGTLRDHGLPDDLVPGTVISVAGVLHRVNSAYDPNLPRRQKVFAILEPINQVGNSAKPKPVEKQIEFPF